MHPSPLRTGRHISLVLAFCQLSCGSPPTPEVRAESNAEKPDKETCLDYSETRNVYFGDLHVHTRYSFDAYIHQVRNSPADAYRFAQGEPVQLPPLDASGVGTRSVRLKRPLDFAAVTDHAEYIGQVMDCWTEGSSSYESGACEGIRSDDEDRIVDWGTGLVVDRPVRLATLCSRPGIDCPSAHREAWDRIRQAAADAHDQTSSCTFTTFVGYEWTGNTRLSNLHRNVLFRNADVPDRPASYFESPTPTALWQSLAEECTDAEGECDAIVIPHNANLSNGRMFATADLDAMTVDQAAAVAALRQRMEPLLEIFQHKGSGECINGLTGVLGAPDEFCDVENLRAPIAEDCGDSIGVLGIVNSGCTSRNDFFRTILLDGMRQMTRLGVNPYMLGAIASSDTHNGTPGAVEEDNFSGHQGMAEGTSSKRLGAPENAPIGVITNPGGLAGIWATENSRDALFDAMRRRETFGTSGPRIVPRFFGGWSLPNNACQDPNLLELAYDKGVPMGGVLEHTSEGAPTFVLQALADTATSAARLHVTQIIKGWIDSQGKAHTKVIDIARDGNGPIPDLETCAPADDGAMSQCGVWTDSDFDPNLPSYYYMRVVENPTCRWSWHECLRLAPVDRPEACSDPEIPKTTREMAWTSPIWYVPS
jgi:hypothetical protein